MPKVTTTPFEPADYIETLEDAKAFLDAALEDGDPRIVADVIGAIVRSKAMAGAAAASGISDEDVRKALDPEGDPSLGATLRVLAALGLRLTTSEQARAA